MGRFIGVGSCVLLLLVLVFSSSLCAESPGAPESVGNAAAVELPDYYSYVADDILDFCRPRKGVWVDLGAGTGSVTFALAAKDNDAARQSTFVLLDPDRKALSAGLHRAEEAGLANRVVAVVGRAEEIPLPDGSVDLVFSRGSIFFWSDPVKGLQEVERVLRPGGEAMIGGGRGSKNPRLKQTASEGGEDNQKAQEEADLSQLSDFARLRHPKTFRKWAEEAELHDFTIIGNGSSSGKDYRGGGGIWVRFTKQEAE